MNKLIHSIRKHFWKPQRVINMWEHIGWGDAIQWFDFDKRRIVGWLSHKPNRGDELRCKMKNGNIVRFRIESVDHCGDPQDMFFADVSDIEIFKQQQ